MIVIVSDLRLLAEFCVRAHVRPSACQKTSLYGV